MTQNGNRSRWYFIMNIHLILKRVKQRKRRLLVELRLCDTVKLRGVPKAECYQAVVERRPWPG